MKLIIGKKNIQNQTVIGGSQVECFEGSEVFHAITGGFATTRVNLNSSIENEKFNIHNVYYTIIHRVIHM